MNNSKNCSSASLNGIRRGIAVPLKNVLTYVFAFCGILLNSCGPSSEEMKIEEARAEAQFILNGQSEITTDTIGGVAHNFIKNANLKFKVKDVFMATKSIENLVSVHGGYITASDLISRVNHKNTVQIKKDTVQELTYYTSNNTIRLRIPARKLDTLIRMVSELAVFVDYRKFTSNDVKLKLAANKLEEARLMQFSKQVKSRSVSNKKADKQIIASASAMLEKQLAADEKSIESYGLAEEVNYSTVTIELYQEQRIDIQITANPIAPDPYVTPFVNKLGEAFVNGFELIKQCILFLVNTWGLILILTVLFLLIRRRMHYQRNKV